MGRGHFPPHAPRPGTKKCLSRIELQKIQFNQAVVVPPLWKEVRSCNDSTFIKEVSNVF